MHSSDALESMKDYGIGLLVGEKPTPEADADCMGIVDMALGGGARVVFALL